MKTKHTKGEWIVKSNSELCWVESKTHHIATVSFGNEANAKLIAAAPELLEALQMAVNILECKNGYHKKFDNPRSIEEMKSAIAKATNQKIEV